MYVNKRIIDYLFIVVISLVFPGCDSDTGGPSPAALSDDLPQEKAGQCDTDNAGLVLPPGFCAAVIADTLGSVRNLAVNSNGDIYVALRNRRLNLGGILGLRDEDGDGRMDKVIRLNNFPALGLAIHDGYLYFASDTTVYRYEIDEMQLVPVSAMEIVIDEFPVQDMHAGKSFTIDDRGYLYINVGAPSNNCAGEDEKTGLAPCPELEAHAGIWKFSTARTGQRFSRDGLKYAGGIRNAYALDWHTDAKRLFLIQHGRDRLRELWPALYTTEQDSLLPAEEFLQVSEGMTFSWPYCYFDEIQNKLIQSPEYDGDKTASTDCRQFPDPVLGFPGHYGPNALKFYTGNQFPERYLHGAFIAFHGSYHQETGQYLGHKVVFVPYQDRGMGKTWEVFIDGFVSSDSSNQIESSIYRPTGLAQGPEGALYVADSTQGRIWKISYTGLNEN